MCYCRHRIIFSSAYNIFAIQPAALQTVPSQSAYPLVRLAFSILRVPRCASMVFWYMWPLQWPLRRRCFGGKNLYMRLRVFFSCCTIMSFSFCESGISPPHHRPRKRYHSRGKLCEMIFDNPISGLACEACSSAPSLATVLLYLFAAFRR